MQNVANCSDSALLAHLQAQIEVRFDSDSPANADDFELLRQFRESLNLGIVRAASLADGAWVVNPWVKKGILLHARWGRLCDVSPFEQRTHFDFDILPPRHFTPADRVRVPSGGTIVRDGCYLGPGVTCMPPSFVNLGCWIGPGVSLDSHVMIGPCSQIGEGARVSSGTQIGGVLSPLEAFPAIIGNHAVIGGNCGIYDGVFLGEGALIYAGTVLTAQSRVYDLRTKRMYRAGAGQPLTIPPGSIVMPGARPLTKGAGAGSGLLIQVPIIVGNTDTAENPEDLLADLMD